MIDKLSNDGIESIQALKSIFNLPNDILSKIYEYDSTYHVMFKSVISEINMFPIWNVVYFENIKNETNNSIYYCKKIANDMLCHWNNHYTSFTDSLLNYTTTVSDNTNGRVLVNYLDSNSIESPIPGRKHNIFEWIKYYNLITSR